MAIGAAVAVAGSIAQGVMGAVQASKAKKAIANYKRQELTNVAEGIEVSRLGADLKSEQLAVATATSVDALRQGGVRGVVGGIGKVQNSVVQQSREIAADLDMQEKERQKLIAQDDARIRQMQEEREKADLAGLGQQQAVGQQNLFSGIQGASTALAGMGSFGGGTSGAAGAGAVSGAVS